MERRKPAAIRQPRRCGMGPSGWTPDDATTALLDKAEKQIPRHRRAPCCGASCQLAVLPFDKTAPT